MDIYYHKYQKYKFKYLDLPQQTGGKRNRKSKRRTNKKLKRQEEQKIPFNIVTTLNKLNKLAEQLQKSDIYLLEVEACPRCPGEIDLEYAKDNAISKIAKIKKIISDSAISGIPDTISFIYYREVEDVSAAESNGSLQLYHNILQKDNDLIMDVFQQEFEGAFDWNGEADKPINITLPPFD